MFEFLFILLRVLGLVEVFLLEWTNRISSRPIRWYFIYKNNNKIKKQKKVYLPDKKHTETCGSNKNGLLYCRTAHPFSFLFSTVYRFSAWSGTLLSDDDVRLQPHKEYTSAFLGSRYYFRSKSLSVDSRSSINIFHNSFSLVHELYEHLSSSHFSYFLSTFSSVAEVYY